MVMEFYYILMLQCENKKDSNLYYYQILDLIGI